MSHWPLLFVVSLATTRTINSAAAKSRANG